VADGPDVRALSYLLSAGANGHRPVRCMGCPFARPYLVEGGRVTCTLFDGPEQVLDPDHPACTARDWGDRARQDLARLLSDNAVLTAVARDAREESSMYARGLAEGRAAEREACCKAVCPDCRKGVPAVYDELGGFWCHRSEVRNTFRSCLADAVRRRADDDGR
jgi:hypothetical protein